jgi:hypothetical protein
LLLPHNVQQQTVLIVQMLSEMLTTPTAFAFHFLGKFPLNHQLNHMVINNPASVQ